MITSALLYRDREFAYLEQTMIGFSKDEIAPEEIAPNAVMHVATNETEFEGSWRSCTRWVKRYYLGVSMRWDCKRRLPQPRTARLWLIWRGVHPKLQGVAIAA
jgi:hypothetical protein